MKRLSLFLIGILAFISLTAQETPANRTRSGDAFTQIDNYLVAMKRLGIPTGDTPTLDALTNSENTAKLFFNTSDTSLYVYRDDLQEWLKVSADSDGGTVSSVGLTAPTGFEVSNSPITSSGDLELEFEEGYSLPSNEKQDNWDEAYSWGDFREYGLGITNPQTIIPDDLSPSQFTRLTNRNNPFGLAGSLLNINYNQSFATQILSGNRAGEDIVYRKLIEGNWTDVYTLWDERNHRSDSQSDNRYLRLTTNQTVSGIKTFEDSPLVPVPTSDEQSANKEYVDEQVSSVEAPFEIIDVTQQAYSDIAINVKDFGNTQAGMTYQEGAIDFGVSRNIIHQMGLYSFKAGLETTSSGTASSAFGGQTIASGFASSAFGDNTTASGDYSSAFGQFTEASGDYSSSFGTGTTASGNSSSAFGYVAEASGSYSSSFGDNTTASGDYSSAFGQLTEASGNSSSAFGNNNIASGDYSSSFGNNNVSNEYTSLTIGVYSTDGTPEISWVDGSPIFKVGNGKSANDRKNAYTLYNDGRSEQESTFEITTPGEGIILSSPDGTRWEITVDNNGGLTTTEL